MQFNYLAIALSLVIYLISVVDAARSLSRRRAWNAPPRRRDGAGVKR